MLSLSSAGSQYRSGSQQARVFTERWVSKTAYCLDCGIPDLESFPANTPVADFLCKNCGSQYELKSRNGKFGNVVTNGAYSKKIERITSDTSPHLLLLEYNKKLMVATGFSAIPGFFLTPSIIQKRKPLAPTARRAGWVGSNILLHSVPKMGRVAMIESGRAMDKDRVLEEWRLAAKLRNETVQARGWLIDVLNFVEQIPSAEFTLADAYSFEKQLQRLYPDNKNVKPKIRQQMQVMRAMGLLDFLGKGKYRKTGALLKATPSAR